MKDNKSIIIILCLISLILGLSVSYFYKSNSCENEKQEMQEMIGSSISQNWLVNVQPILIEYSFLKAEKELGRAVLIPELLFEKGVKYPSSYFYSQKNVELKIGKGLESVASVGEEFPNQILDSQSAFKSVVYTCCSEEKCIVSIGEWINSC